MPASRTAVDGLDVVPVAVGRQDPADAGRPADLEQQLVLVGGVEQHRVARALARAARTRCSRTARRRACRSGRRSSRSGRAAARHQHARRTGAAGNLTERSSTVAATRWTSSTPREEAAFRDEVRTWLAEHLWASSPSSAAAAGRPTRPAGTSASSGSGSSGRTAGSACRGPRSTAGATPSFAEQVIFNEEYAKADAPARVSFFGEGLFAPTLLAYGTEEQKRASSRRSSRVEELWCQGYSEPNAGSDLSNVQTRARARRRPVGRSTGRRSGRRSRTARSGASASCAPTRRAGAQGPLVPPRPDGPARRRRSAR